MLFIHFSVKVVIHEKWAVVDIIISGDAAKMNFLSALFMPTQVGRRSEFWVCNLLKQRQRVRSSFSNLIRTGRGLLSTHVLLHKHLAPVQIHTWEQQRVQASPLEFLKKVEIFIHPGHRCLQSPRADAAWLVVGKSWRYFTSPPKGLFSSNVAIVRNRLLLRAFRLTSGLLWAVVIGFHGDQVWRVSELSLSHYILLRAGGWMQWMFCIIHSILYCTVLCESSCSFEED